MSAHKPLGGRLLNGPFLVFFGLFVIGLIFIAQRYLGGLGGDGFAGPATNLNDGYTWGIWAVIDVMIGSAFGCAGYAIALLVYILNKGEYHPLVRPALLASLFGYTLAGIGVMLDLGRYWHFYHMFMPSMAHTDSVMMEVGWCVAAYTLVLWIEFTPAFLERLGLSNLRAKLNKVLFVFIALGVLLPTMHQSSLGTMLVILGYQVNPLWQTQWIPLIFVSTALLMGFALVVFESLLASTGFNRPFETPILAKLTKVMVVLTVGILAFRFAELLLRGDLGHAFDGSRESLFFWLENALIGGSALLLATPRARRAPRRLFLGAVALLLGGSLLRINAYLIGYEPAGGGWHYFPSVPETMVTVGIFSLEVLLYLIFVRALPVLHAVPDKTTQTQPDALSAAE